MSDVSKLFVTCCLEPTRVEILKVVIDNMHKIAPELLENITVFDNGSTQPGVDELLVTNFKHVVKADVNVGYWTAIDWWLTSISDRDPAYVYIVESDMIHYDYDRFDSVVKFLDSNHDIGSCRLHEYSVENKRLYDKDNPVTGSKRNIWQSHTNKVTGMPVELKIGSQADSIYVTNFLTQLPALNRYSTMIKCFDALRKMKSFSEYDFQRLYHKEFSKIALLNGGMFHGDPGSWGSDTITGSWSTSEELKRTGYQSTRFSSILEPEKYIVKILL